MEKLVLTLQTMAATPTGSLPFTGDHTPFALIGIIMAVALVAIIVIVVMMKKKK